MLTLKECIEFTDLCEEEIDAIAEHEHLPFVLALERGAAMMNETWGPTAVRQMIWDDYLTAEAQGETDHAAMLRCLYGRACEHLHADTERRHEERAGMAA